MVSTEGGEHVAGGEHVELGIPRIIVGVGCLVVGNGVKPSLFTFDAAPMVDDLVAGNTHEPTDRHLCDDTALDRVDRCQKDLRGEVFGNRSIATSAMEVGVDLRQRVVVQGEQRVAVRRPGVRGGTGDAHNPFIVPNGSTPTGRV